MNSFIGHASTSRVFTPEVIGNVQTYAEKSVGMLGCPGLKLAVSCGNGKCEPKQGENADTCPVDCVPPLIKSYNNQTLCRGVTHVYKPTTTAEVQEIVHNAYMHGQKVRVVGKLHSANEQLCTTGVIISTESLNRVIGIETFNGKETVVTEPGTTLFELADWLHAKNRSLGYALIGFRGVSVAGAAATGSHGSSMKHSNIISSAVETMWIVNSRGELNEYSELNTKPTTWKALRANLGMLGVVVRLRMKIQPQFNLDVNVTFHNDRELFRRTGAMSLVRDCDYGLLNWFPGTHRVMKTCGTVTNEKVTPEANNSLLDPVIPSWLADPFKSVLQYGACYRPISCLMENFRYLDLRFKPPFMGKNEFGMVEPMDSLVGPSHRMVTSNLSPYQAGLTQMDWELAVPSSKAQAALEAVREHIRKNKICLPLVGVFLRFAPSEDATLLAHTVSDGEFKKGEPVMFIEMPVYLPHGFTKEQRAQYDRPFEDIVKMLITNFNARPHWGKNRDWAFVLARDLKSYGQKFNEFREIVSELDPSGTFMNDWGRRVGLDSGELVSH